MALFTLFYCFEFFTPTFRGLYLVGGGRIFGTKIDFFKVVLKLFGHYFGLKGPILACSIDPKYILVTTKIEIFW